MSKGAIWTGRILSWLAGLFVLTSGLNLMFVHTPEMMANFAKFGYADSLMPKIGVAALVCSLLYLIPRTEVLGAVLLAGYLGGAVATHLRIGDPAFVAPLVVGVVLWLGLFLRNQRVRAAFLRH